MYLYKQVRPTIIAFRPNRETLGGTAYALKRSMTAAETGAQDTGGNVLIDCPTPTDDVCSFLEELGGVRWLILTHRTAMGKPGSSNACVAKLVQRFDCQVVIQEQEAYLLPDLPLQTFGDRLELTPDIEVLWTPGHTPGSSCVLYRQDGGVLFTGRHLLPNESGQLVTSYKIFRCWVSEYQALPELDASANAVAIQSIKLENEGWERDYDVTEPTEPSFTEPS